MQRWARRSLSGVAVVGLAAGLLAIGTAAGAPPDVAPAPAAAPAGRTAQGQTVAQLQSDLDRVPGNWSAWSALGLAYVLEGSALGARLLDRQARALGLDAGFGARHLAAQTADLAAWHTFLGALEAADPFDLDAASIAADGIGPNGMGPKGT